MRKRPPEFFMKRANRLAAERGGELLSTRYLGDEAKLRFRCANGHQFLQSSGGLAQGHWCRICDVARRTSRFRPAMLERVRIAVERMGGELLSSDYVNNSTKLSCRCGKGHEWMAIPASLLLGEWCPACAARARGEKRRRAVARRLEIRAQKTGYEILAPGFLGAHRPLILKCPEGHPWRTTSVSFEKGIPCPVCRESQLLARMKAKAEEWGGLCLGRGVRSVTHPVAWRCAQGHRFVSPADRVFRGTWCKRCRSTVTGDLERMKKIARERGGECLSFWYRGSVTKLRWRCAEGHLWRADPGSVVMGTWCPTCRRRGGHSLARLSIEIMQTLAADRGGACLSREYHGSKTHLRWRCARGHEWETLPSRIRQGDWCPVCSHKAPFSLEGLRAVAIERGGRCLSSSWDNHHESLIFECSRGHEFRMNANVVKTGVWCPTCRASEAASSAERQSQDDLVTR